MDLSSRHSSFTPPPDPQVLLPPLLASLPASLVSTQPPPPVLPLLSPILRQKVKYLSSLSTTDPWVQLLCWDSTKAEKLQKVIEQSIFEPHPVSGEVEVPESLDIKYKRSDWETLYASLDLRSDYDLIAIYIWCSDDPEGDGPGWKVAEVLPSNGLDADAANWVESMSYADLLQERRDMEAKTAAAQRKTTPHASHAREDHGEEEGEEEDDDGYWAMYDDNAGETPGNTSPAPVPATQARGATLTDSGYYERYDEVQPALDHDDPSMSRDAAGQSSFNGDLLASLLRNHEKLFAPQEGSNEVGERDPQAQGNVLFPGPTQRPNREREDSMSHPRPSISSEASSETTVDKLEETAETHLMENAVKSHVSSSLKSLFKLAKSTGMSKAEFRSFLHEELDGLKSDSD
ncbi:hypothetical protein KEM55_003806 [Ascosphaera atra]|nr:hypothetical protein KEM55_003806 [Ascosphaera atra]